MAGEDPGAGVITLILDLIKRGWDVVTSTVKTAFQTGLFVYFRKQMMRAQQGPKLKYGKQSLKHLRRHEDRGAQLSSVGIGDRKAMKALDKELKTLKLDYAITKSNGEYTLHYKSVNDRDVLLAQQHALENRFGDPETAYEGQKMPNEETPEQENQQDRQERDPFDQRQEQIDENARQEQNQEQEREQAEENAPEQEEQERRQETADRDQDDQEQPDLHQEISQPLPYRNRQIHRGRPSPDRVDPHADLADAPLSDIIAVARKRARAKNLARNAPDHSMKLHRGRSPSRDIELGRC